MDSSRNIIKKLRESRLLRERTDYEKMDHAELVKLAQDGDQFALETLMRLYDPAIEKAASKFIFDSGDREDAKQIASIGFWEAVKDWNGRGSFGSYANMIMNRKLTDQLRKDSAGKQLIHSQAASLDAPVASDDEGGEMTLGASLPSDRVSPEEEYLGRDGAREIMRFLQEELSDTERDIVKRYIQGYKISEISEETGLKYKSVENAMKRVKDKLAAYMKNIRESKKLEESESIFTDEEKEVLNSLLGKIEMRESKKMKLKESYMEYTEDQIDDLLSEIEEEIHDIEREIKDTHYDDRDELLSQSEDLLDKIYVVQGIDNATDEQVEAAGDLQYRLMNLSDLPYEGDKVHTRDPYKEVGMSRSDFM